MRLRASILAAAALVSWQTAALASDPAIAREQLKIGYALAEEGNCGEALPHLVESLRLDPRAITLINLADCEERLGKLSDAMMHWIDARSRAQAEGARSIEGEAESRATALEPRLARLTIVLAKTAPAGATVERDGVVLGAPSLGIPLPMNPGSHTIVVKVTGRPDRAMQIALAEGETKRVEVDAATDGARPILATGIAEQGGQLEPTGGRSWSPIALAGFGVAAAAVATGTVTGLMAMSAGSKAETACPDLGCDRRALDDVASGRTLATASTVAFAVAGASALVGLYGVIWDGKSTTTAPAASIGIGLAASNVSLRGRF